MKRIDVFLLCFAIVIFIVDVNSSELPLSRTPKSEMVRIMRDLRFHHKTGYIENLGKSDKNDIVLCRNCIANGK